MPPVMTDQDDRNVESRETGDTAFERELDEETSGRREAAERVQDEPLPEPADG